MKKSILLAAFAIAVLVAPVTFANGGSKKQTPKQEAKTEKKQEKVAKKESKTDMKVAKHSRHHKAKKAA